jgi:hypothetical protein
MPPKKELEIKHYDSKELKMRIRGKFPHPAWVVLEELRDGTGFVSSGREADAVAFGTWPSRGFQIIGFEVKSRRSDWLSELKNPEKMEAIGQFCDQWWIVCSEAVAKLEEMPQTWGWLIPSGNGLKVLKQAEKLKPLPADRVLLMSIVRNISNNYTLLSSLEEAAQERAKSITEWKDREIERLELQYKNLCEEVKKFQELSGISIHGEWKYPIERIGKTIKAVMDYDNQIKDKLKKAKENYTIAKNTVESLEALSFVGFTEEEL